MKRQLVLNREDYAELRSDSLNDGKPIPLMLKRWDAKVIQDCPVFVEFEAVLLSSGQDIKPFGVKRILQSGNRVIVFWNDNTKTIVKRSEDTEDDIYGAFTAALAIKVYGSNSQVHRVIDRKHERIDKINGKQYVVSNYEERKAVRKWMKERGHGKKVD